VTEKWISLPGRSLAPDGRPRGGACSERSRERSLGRASRRGAASDDGAQGTKIISGSRCGALLAPLVAAPARPLYESRRRVTPRGALRRARGCFVRRAFARRPGAFFFDPAAAWVAVASAFRARRGRPRKRRQAARSQKRFALDLRVPRFETVGMDETNVKGEG
jgi:hypothetical protein